MNSRSRTLVLLAALGVVAPMACVAESVPDGVTETGNPPVVERDRIAVDLDGDVAKVTGSPGAVPEGSKVRIENTRSGAAKTATAGDDGSFAVEVPARAGDAIEIEVKGEGGTLRIAIDVSAGSADAGDGTPELSESTNPEDSDTDEPTPPVNPEDSGVQGGYCGELEAALRLEYGALANDVDKSCTQNSDCVKLSTPLECLTWTCRTQEPVSVAGQAQVDAKLPALDAKCAEMLAIDCPTGFIPCPAPFPGEVACVEGMCTTGVDVPASACDTFATWIDEFWQGVDDSCEQDDDCVVAPVDPSCGTAQYHAVAKTERAVLEGRSTEIDQFCTNRGECPTPDIEFPKPQLAACNVNQCEIVINPDCNSVATASASQLRDFISDLDNSCTEDAECMITNFTTSCSSDCTEVVVATTFADAIEAKRAELSTEVCGDFTRDDCGGGCPAIDQFPNGPGCVEGQCGAKPDDPAE
jgi:hypothetical protein